MLAMKVSSYMSAREALNNIDLPSTNSSQPYHQVSVHVLTLRSCLQDNTATLRWP